MFQSKDTGWQNGLKNKTHIYAAYKRLTSDPNTQVKEWKKMFHANRN